MKSMKLFGAGMLTVGMLAWMTYGIDVNTPKSQNKVVRPMDSGQATDETQPARVLGSSPSFVTPAKQSGAGRGAKIAPPRRVLLDGEEISFGRVESVVAAGGTPRQLNVNPNVDAGSANFYAAEGGACNCDADCPAPVSQCSRANCLNGACRELFRPNNSWCDLDGLWCTQDRCDGGGQCQPKTLSRCVHECDEDSSNTGDTCTSTGSCQPGDCVPVGICNESAQRCELFGDIGRCCLADPACVYLSEAECNPEGGHWLRFADTDDADDPCFCPTYSAGIAPRGTVGTDLGPVRPPFQVCAGALAAQTDPLEPIRRCIDPELDCSKRCVGGTNAGDICTDDPDCPGSVCGFDVCVDDPNNCHAGFRRLGDDYRMANGSFLHLKQLRIHGGVENSREILTFQFYDNANPPQLVDQQAFVLDTSGSGNDYITLNFDCAPRCNAARGEVARSIPFVIPPEGWVVMRTIRNLGLENGGGTQDPAEFGNGHWVTTDTTDVGSNDPGLLWIDDGPTTTLPTGVTTGTLSFELFGQSIPDPKGACCDPDVPGVCTDTNIWQCRECTRETDPTTRVCSESRDCGLTDICIGPNWHGPKSRNDFADDGGDSCVSGICDTGRCCLPDGSCQVLDPASCEDPQGENGVFASPGSNCDPNCCTQAELTWGDCCGDMFLCENGGSILADETCITNADCDQNRGRCADDTICSVASQDCADTSPCQGPNNCELCKGPTTQDIDVPSFLLGPNDPERTVVVGLSGDTSDPSIRFGRVQGDTCTLADTDVGVYEKFSFQGHCETNFFATGGVPCTYDNECDLLAEERCVGGCAVVTIDFCCTSPPFSPVWFSLHDVSETCACDLSAINLMTPDRNAVGISQSGFGANCGHDDPFDPDRQDCCTDQNPSWQATLPSGTYLYQISAAQFCQNTTLSCLSDDDCAGVACTVAGQQYQLHLTVEPCRRAACCLNIPCTSDADCDSVYTSTCDTSNGFCSSGCLQTTELECEGKLIDGIVPDNPGNWLGDLEQPAAQCSPDFTPENNVCRIGVCCTGPGECNDDPGPVPTDFTTPNGCLANDFDNVFHGGVTCADNPCPVCPFGDPEHCQGGNPAGIVQNSDRNLGRRLADDIRIPADGVIDRVCWWGCWGPPQFPAGLPACDANPPNNNEDWQIVFYEDAFGRPEESTRVVYNVIPDGAATIDGLTCWDMTASIDPPLPVTADECIWVEITGNGTATCYASLVTSAVGNSYSFRDADGSYGIEDVDDADYSFCVSSGLTPGGSPGIDGGCGDLVGACCTIQSGNPPVCDDSGPLSTRNACNNALGYFEPAAICGVDACPDPANDLCENAEPVCPSTFEDPDIGVCQAAPDQPCLKSAATGQVGSCQVLGNDFGPCMDLPDGAVSARCSFDTDNRLAQTDGPNTAGTECLSSGSTSFQADVWHTMISPCTGRMHVNMCGAATYDSMLTVYSDHTPTCLSCPISNNAFALACNDNFCEGAFSTASAVTVDVIKDGCYTFRVGGWSELGTAFDGEQSISTADVIISCDQIPDAEPPGLPGVVGGINHGIRKQRFLSIKPNNPGVQSRMRLSLLDKGCSVTGKQCDTDASCTVCDAGSTNADDPCDKDRQCDGGSCVVSGETCEELSPPVVLGFILNPVEAGNDAPPDTLIAGVGADPGFRIWDETLVHITGCQVAPGRVYRVEVEGIDQPGLFAKLDMRTSPKPEGKDWGDIVGNFTGTVWTAGNFLVNVDDVNAIIKFLTLKPAPHVTVCEMLSASGPLYVNMDVSVDELGQIIRCFKGELYPPLPMLLSGYPDLQEGGLLTQCGEVVGLLGACCRSGGTCDVVRRESCSVPHIFRGFNTSCGAPRACCDGQDDCVEMAPACCLAFDDEPNSATTCAPNPCGKGGGNGGGQPAPMPYGGKFRRVDIHGVPMPDRSPTGEGENDRLPNMAYIDMYDLAPMYSVTDVSVPVEGGELTLEFRRTSGIRSFRHSTDAQKRGVTYPSDSILGLGWDTNLASRAIVAFNFSESDPTKATTVRVTDEVGNSHPYFEIGQGIFEPDLVHSFVNNAVQADLLRPDADTLVLVKVFGTRSTYKKVGRFIPPNSQNGSWEDYYRLAYVEDRNGNRLEYVYASSGPNNRRSFLVAEIHEAAHPERKLLFEYTLGTEPSGVDRGDRLNKLTDPLGRVTTFSYGVSQAKPWNLLLQVEREAVPDAENGGTMVQPTVNFAYHAVELPVEETKTPPTMPPSDPTTKNRYVGLRSILDARGHETTFSYMADFFPSSFDQQGDTFYQQKIRLTGASTIDGSVVLTQEIRTGESVITTSQDTRGNTAKYDFVSQILEADNKFGKAIYVTQLTRTSEDLPSNNTAIFQWTPDAFANLIKVTDMNGNTIDYTYGNEASQQSNQPTLRTITDTGDGQTIATFYTYGAFNKLTQLIDGEGKVTTHTLDANGNRTQINEELGKTTIYQYAADGFVEQITDPDLRVTTFSRGFNPIILNRHYTLISTVKGYSGELNLDTQAVSDVLGNEVEMTDPEENVYTYEYDALYRRTRTTNPAVEASPGGVLVTSTMEYTYNLNSSVIEETDDLLNVTVSVFDLMNRPTETRRRMASPASNDDAIDLITKNTYNPVGLVDTNTDRNGNVTQFAYDALLRLSQKTFDANVLAYMETYEYGNNAGSGAFAYTSGWQATRVINHRGFARDTVYDGFYRTVTSISRQTDGVGIAHDSPPAANEPTTHMTYNKVHNEITMTVLAELDAGGDRTTYTFYDDLHRPTISLLDFDGDGNGGGGYTPETTYVNNAAVFGGHDAEDFVTRTVYDLAGNPTTTIDAEGNPTDTTYDGASRVVEVKRAAVAGGRPTTTTVYDDNSNPTLVTDPRGNLTKMVYDARNRLTQSIRDLNGNGTFDPIRPGTDIVTDTHFDLLDNVIRTFDPNGNVNDIEYDRAYRVNFVRGPPVADAENGGKMTSPETRTEYDRNSNVTKVTDPRGVGTVSSFDGLDRITSVTNASGTVDAVTSLTVYDENNNVIAAMLDNGAAGFQTTTFQFDPIDRQFTETWPEAVPLAGDTKITTTEYYRNHLVKSITDPKLQAVESDYDRADRVVTSRHRRTNTSIEEVRSFAYDKMNNALTIADISGTTTFSYDALYRVLTETRSDPGNTAYTVTSAYDLNSNRVTCTYPQTGRVITSTYDRQDRRLTVDDSVVANPSTYTYDANSNIISCTKPNGVVDTNSYDSLNRVLSHVANGGGPNIYQAVYTYDLANQRRSIVETVQGHAARNLSYGYDNQYRITRESWLGNTYTYTYDPAGNRLTKTFNGTTTTYTYDARNELLTETTLGLLTTYSYDENGNRTRKSILSGDTTDYTWDVNDRLIEAELNTAPVFQAVYDYRTRRVKKTESGVDTYFRYDGGVSCQEVQGGTSSINVEFIRGYDLGGGIGSILYSDRSAAGGDDEFFCYNAVGHTVALTDSNAVVSKTNLYEAFGTIVASTGTSSNNRLANTKERDASIGLDNHGFRYYDASTGRYISRDPAGYVGGLNVYVHVGNNPINRYDPNGLFWGFIVDAVTAVADTYQYATGSISGKEYATRMAVTAISVAANVVSGGTGGTAVRAAAKLIRAADKAIEIAQRVEGTVTGLKKVAKGDLSGVLDVALSNTQVIAKGLRKAGGKTGKLDLVDGGGSKPKTRNKGTNSAAGEGLDTKKTSGGTGSTKGAEGCFLAGTLVQTSKGPRAIEAVRVGTRVLTMPDDGPDTGSKPGDEDSSAAGIQNTRSTKLEAVPARLDSLISFSAHQEGDKSHTLTSISAERPTSPETVPFDSATWRLLTLRMSDAGGGTVDLKLLRSPEWIERHRAVPGRSIGLELDEMGLSGHADVLSDDPCPAIPDGPGRVVLGTYVRHSDSVLMIHFYEQVQPVECTRGHPFYSATKDDWVAAGLLKVGDVVRTRSGTALIRSIQEKGGIHRVYNLEIAHDHHYYVSQLALLVHNQCPKDKQNVKAKDRNKQNQKRDLDQKNPFKKKHKKKTSVEKQRDIDRKHDRDAALDQLEGLEKHRMKNPKEIKTNKSKQNLDNIIDQ